MANLRKKIIILPITDIKPYQLNAKVHTDNQVDQIAKSIQEFGFNQPIVVDEHNVVIVGHGRLEAAKKLGMTEVPAICTDDLTKAQVRAYRLTDNRLNESGWDMRLVVEEVKLLKQDGFDIDLTGFKLTLIENVDIVDNPENEWDGMSDFIAKDASAKRQIIISFKNDEDVSSFARLIEQNITPKTRSLWYPKAEIDKVADLVTE